MKTIEKLEVFTLRDQPELGNRIGFLHGQFPDFFAGDAVNRHYWTEIGLFETFPEFQFVFCDVDDQIVACGHSIPLTWDGTVEGLPQGYDGVIAKGFIDREKGRVPNTLSALAAITAPEYKGSGLSYRVVEMMKEIARHWGYHSLIAPVRPSWKSRYPLTPIERYVSWVRDDGRPFDPWLRVHKNLGGTLLRIEPISMVAEGSLSDWERWTGMSFPESGEYVVPGGLNVVHVDVESRKGTYKEPNVWICHKVDDEA